MFQLELHSRDEDLLKQIRAHFNGAGSISKKSKRDVCTYSVGSMEHLTKVIIPHFDQYPLKTQKLADYQLFREIVMMIQRKEHLTQEGFERIVAIKASINWGLSDKLKTAFPNITPMPRLLVSGFSLSEGKIEYLY